MTRSLIGLSVLLFGALIASLVIGFASVAPAMLIVGLLCALPMFCLALGAALGRISNELTITRKAPAQMVGNRTTRVNSHNVNVPERLG